MKNTSPQEYIIVKKRKHLSKQLNKESKLVSEDSLKVLAEFEKLTGLKK
jgi:hypothetical protein